MVLEESHFNTVVMIAPAPSTANPVTTISAATARTSLRTAELECSGSRVAIGSRRARTAVTKNKCSLVSIKKLCANGHCPWRINTFSAG